MQVPHIEKLCALSEILSAKQHRERSKIAELRNLVDEISRDRRVHQPAQCAAIAVRMLECLYSIRSLVERVIAGDLPQTEDDPVGGITEVSPELAGAIKFVTDFLMDHAVAVVSTDTSVKDHIRSGLMNALDDVKQVKSDAEMAASLQAQFEREHLESKSAAQPKTKILTFPVTKPMVAPRAVSKEQSRAARQ